MLPVAAHTTTVAITRSQSHSTTTFTPGRYPTGLMVTLTKKTPRLLMVVVIWPITTILASTSRLATLEHKTDPSTSDSVRDRFC